MAAVRIPVRELSETVYQQVAGKFIRYNVPLTRLPGLVLNDVHTSLER
jgi:hypothetical protein